jgi:hypothetical protein
VKLELFFLMRTESLSTSEIVKKETQEEDTRTVRVERLVEFPMAVVVPVWPRQRIIPTEPLASPTEAVVLVVEVLV